MTKSPTTKCPTIRQASAEDLVQVAALDRDCFSNPWSVEQFEAERANPIGFVDICFEPREHPNSKEGQLLGYVVGWVVAGEGHLLRIATAPHLRRSGLGKLLIEVLLQRARNAACSSVILEVGSRNQSAIALYQRFGFLEVGRRAGYYVADNDDAVLMTLSM